MMALDKQVLDIIESKQGVVFSYILSQLAHQNYRQVDRALQRLRKAGIICYEKGRWWSKRI